MSKFISKIFRWRSSLKRYIEVSRVSEISRRYFIMNSFDGVMTILGIVFGSLIANITQSKFILAAGLGASLAMFLSGFTGTYMTEKAERLKKFKELERDLLGSLDNTIHKRAVEIASIIAALIDGVSPLISSVIAISPFFFVSFGLLSMEIAYFSSILLSLCLLFLLGVFLGKISRENIIISGLKMLLAGLLVAVVSLLLSGL